MACASPYAAENASDAGDGAAEEAPPRSDADAADPVEAATLPEGSVDDATVDAITLDAAGEGATVFFDGGPID